jgi:thiamine biosynthesis lipoprotein
MDIAYEKFAHDAMATAFEVLIYGHERSLASSAARAAFDVLDKIELDISRFIESSDIYRINRLAPGATTRVGLHAMACLTIAVELAQDTQGAFDVTIGPLMQCWRNPDRSPRQPSPAELESVRGRMGANLLIIDEPVFEVGVKAAGVDVDLGAIGKGYAIDQMLEVLREWDIDCAFISGGGSTVYGHGAPDGKPGWPVGVGGSGDDADPREVVHLCDMALSGSGFAVRGRHIMNPRTGQPVTDKTATWACCNSAAVSDCLSTAFVVMPIAEVEAYCAAHKNVGAIIIEAGPEKCLRRFGQWPDAT